MVAKPIIDARTGAPLTRKDFKRGQLRHSADLSERPGAAQAWGPDEAGYCLAVIVARGSAAVGSTRKAIATYLLSVAGRAPPPLDAALRLAAADLTGRAGGMMPVKSNAWSLASLHLALVILETAGDRA